METKRLQKVIAEAGIASRRKAEAMIAEGLVMVNGKIVKELGTSVSENDIIEVNGVIYNQENKVAYLFHKPQKVMTTVRDDRQRQKVVDYFKNIPERIYPVGRLDYMTSGALVMTNDGELANLMMHPSSHLEKEYFATLNKWFDSRLISVLENGVDLKDGRTAPAKAMLIEDKVVKIIIHEGRNRQVRRMFSALGYEVKNLHRRAVGILHIDDLKTGEYRPLTSSEIAQIKKICLEHKMTNQVPDYKRQINEKK